MRKFTFFLTVSALIGAAFLGGRWYASHASGQATPGRTILYWYDPMHPSYHADKPGIAPDCGMKLAPRYAGETAAADMSVSPKGKALYYRDPQDPKYTSDKPGLNPETGNELEAVYASSPMSMAPGTVRITPEKLQEIGVRYGTVELATAGARTLREVGKVVVDERRITHVHSKVDGWVEKVFADFTGEAVHKAQPLLTVYSPDMLASEQEYLLALQARHVLHRSMLPETGDYAQSMIDAARRRLQLWDLTDAQIDEITRTGRPVKSYTIYAPANGTVMERKAFPNLRISPDTDLYVLTDLSHIWILADVFEADIPNVRLGEYATVTPSYEPAHAFRARITYIMPEVDPVTRTLKVRFEADNPGLRLKPDMFVNVDISVPIPATLGVPADAVLDSGLRKTVFVARGNGYFEPREVQTGQHFGDRIQILGGLSEGERIVTSGNFLIDSESQLNAAVGGMEAPAAPPAHEGRHHD